jgi:hypothetical protein
MINWNLLLTGLIALLIGLVGLATTGDRKKMNSSQGRAFGTSIVLLILGILGIIWSFFSNEQ